MKVTPLSILVGFTLVVSATAGPPPAGLPPPPIPAANPLTPEKILLGKTLFFDPNLSTENLSCASCHKPEHAFADTLPLSKGNAGIPTWRNASSLLNAAYVPQLMSDGRAASLEDQVQIPVTNPIEMNTPLATVVSYVSSEPAYQKLFVSAFGDASVTWERVSMAIASFERTLIAGDSAFDRFTRGDPTGFSDEARRGWELFKNDAGCISCHVYSAGSPFFTDFGFHNTGVSWFPKTDLPANERLKPDLGRYWISKKREHTAAFRTPSLRNVARTSPYMHDGSLASLREVIDFYSNEPRENPYLDSRMRPLELTERDRSDLIAFLESLSSPDLSSANEGNSTRTDGEPSGNKESR